MFSAVRFVCEPNESAINIETGESTRIRNLFSGPVVGFTMVISLGGVDVASIIFCSNKSRMFWFSRISECTLFTLGPLLAKGRSRKYVDVAIALALGVTTVLSPSSVKMGSWSMYGVMGQAMGVLVSGSSMHTLRSLAT